MGNHIIKSITPNEKIVYEAKIHWIALLPNFIAVVFCIFLLGVSEQNRGLALFLLVIAAIFALKKIIAIVTTELGFTNARVIGKKGLIKTVELNAPIQKIDHMSISSGLFGKIFGYGKITISSHASMYIFKYVAAPQKFTNALNAQINDL